jgi:hypothetical protein
MAEPEVPNTDPYAFLYDPIASAQSHIQTGWIPAHPPYVVAPPPQIRVDPEFFIRQQILTEQLDAQQARLRSQRRLIIIQIVLLVLWCLLQAVSVLQRMGKLG